MWNMKPMRYILAFFILAICLPRIASALPLDLAPSPPDMSFGFVTVAYSAASDTLTVQGFATNFLDDLGVSQTVDGGELNMTAIIDDGGNLISGSFVITGTIPSLGLLSGTLLTADLTLFGDINPIDLDTFNFLAASTGGDLSGTYGSLIGVILNGTGGFANDWSVDFGQSFTGSADITTPQGSAPVAATWPLLGLGLLGMAYTRRRRHL
jgi:hypothetical protein